MRQVNYLLLITASLMVIAVSCAQTSVNVVSPGLSESNPMASTASGQSHTNLWGYYDVIIDIETLTVEAVVDRNMMFTANVVNFLNGKTANLGFKINGTPTGPDYIDVDIDVSITHPFPGLPQYNGYDVRGVFMGDGSAALQYNSDLIYPVLGTDQYMLADPADDIGGPDGYTRWFNKSEFSTGGMPLFQYTQGKLASPGYSGTATLNSYKYFADNLGKNEVLWSWLQANPEKHGQFSSGVTNTRNYYLRFPNAKGVKYSYAVLAGWKGVAPENHPSNAPEAVALKLVDNSNMYYVSPSEKGGSMIFDISVWDWDSNPSAGVMEDYKIFVESTVLSSVYEFQPGDMTPIGGGNSYSTYHVEIPADNLQSTSGNKCWIIVEQQGLDYTNEFGITNLADTDPLASFFRYDLHVGSTGTNDDPICILAITTPMPAEGWTPVNVTFDASASYDPDGDPISFEWDFDGDGVYGENPDDSYTGNANKPTHSYALNYTGKVWVRVKDNNGGESTCKVDIVVITHPLKNIDITYAGAQARDICIDHSTGDILALYSNGKVRRYTYASYYKSSTEFNTNVNNLYIDASPFNSALNDSFIISGRSVTYPDYPQIFLNNYNSAGVAQYSHTEGFGCTQPGDGVVIKDVFAMGSNGERKFAHSAVHYWDAYGNAGAFKGTHILGREFGGTPPYSTWSYYINYIHWSTQTASGTSVYGPWVRGAESDRNGDWVWFVEAVDCTASRWTVPPHSVGPGNAYSYAGPFFGTPGSPGDDNNKLNDPQDITRDIQNHYYVLDRLSTGNFSIKAFSYTSSSTTALGQFGSSADWDLTPVRIEGSDFNPNVIVLHTSGNNAMVSVFTEDETPG